jgi:hypothetical protein
MRKRSPIRAAGILAFLVAGAMALAPNGFAGSDAGAYTTRPVLLGGPSGSDGINGVTQVGPNINVTHKPDAQSEVTVAVDPTNPKHILTSSNDLGETTIIYESFDNGRNWVDSGLNLGNEFCYDPWLTFNDVGDAFFAYECFSGTIQRVGARHAGEAQWIKTNLPAAGGFPDRDMIVSDNTPSSPFYHSVYLGYDDAAANNSAYLMYSRNGFRGWVRTPKINDSSSTIGVNASVAPDGTVYATWLDFPGKKIMVDKSTDGGVTWGQDRVVTNMRLATGQFFICIPPQPDRCVVPMPFSAMSPAGTPNAGRLYISYPDKSPTSSDWDVYVRFSDDGVVWSPEVEVDNEAVNAYQFFPEPAVTKNGTVGVSFYDTRDDQPANEKTHRYIAYSINGGVTWVNERITTEQSDESGFGDPNDYGDYEGLDSNTANSFWAAWADSRPSANEEDIFAARARL